MSLTFNSKIAGALYGGAIGDGIGAPVEGMLRSEILELVGPVSGFIAPTARIEGRWTFVDRLDGKGDGRITDDTLMVEALLSAYGETRGHLDAWAYKEVFARGVALNHVWVPEYQRKMPVIDRLASAEQYQIRGLLNSNRDPRFFGSSLFQITCGGAMFAWPIGAVNAGDPLSAYQEAVAFFAAQTFSFGLEQAAVMAAAMAAALAPGATAEEVFDAAVNVAKDATRKMILLATSALTSGGNRNTDLPAIRSAVEALHHKRSHISDTEELHKLSADTDGPSNRGLESRLHTSEELPVALALLLRAEGDPWESICSGAEYGEDADSIAAMAGSLAGALQGMEGIPAEWRAHVDSRNRRNYGDLAASFVNTIRSICSDDNNRHQRRKKAIEGRD